MGVGRPIDCLLLLSCFAPLFLGHITIVLFVYFSLPFSLLASGSVTASLHWFQFFSLELLGTRTIDGGGGGLFALSIRLIYLDSGSS